MLFYENTILSCYFSFINRKPCNTVKIDRSLLMILAMELYSNLILKQYEDGHHYCILTTTVQLHSAKPELRFFAGSKPGRGVLQICIGEDLRQWTLLKIRLNAFHRPTIPQKNNSWSFNTPFQSFFLGLKRFSFSFDTLYINIESFK